MVTKVLRKSAEKMKVIEPKNIFMLKNSVWGRVIYYNNMSKINYKLKVINNNIYNM